jgi:hypothetical protein
MLLQLTIIKRLKAEAEINILKLEAKINDLAEKIEFDYYIFSLVDKSLENLKPYWFISGSRYGGRAVYNWFDLSGKIRF